ncbi:MAG: sulfur carrier protein ThiS [Ruminiclostridium sp.]|nr:sulfur carrier protein ThiS [Ruminiclostridium sp.]
MIVFIVNGESIELEEPISISSYLDSTGINPQSVVIEYNYQIPDKQKWKDIILKDGDNLEIVKFMGGG